MASSAVTSHGTLLQKADTVYPGDSNYTTIAEITSDIDLTFDKDMIDVTHMGSGGYRDFKGGIKQISPLTLEVNFLPTDDTQDFTAGLGQQWEDDSVYNFKLTLTDGSSTNYKFAARVKSVAVKASVAGVLKGTIVLQPTGAPSATLA